MLLKTKIVIYKIMCIGSNCEFGQSKFNNYLLIASNHPLISDLFMTSIILLTYSPRRNIKNCHF